VTSARHAMRFDTFAMIMAFLVCCLPQGAWGLVEPLRSVTRSRSVVTMSGDDGYGLVGTLARQGPVPLVVRVTQPEKYENSVKVYMAKERCSRTEAQGNMDAFFANENDWTFQKLQERKGAAKVDYGKLPSIERLALTAVWALIVFGLLGKIILYGW